MVGERHAKREATAGMSPPCRLAARITGRALTASHHHAAATPVGLRVPAVPVSAHGREIEGRDISMRLVELDFQLSGQAFIFR